MNGRIRLTRGFVVFPHNSSVEIESATSWLLLPQRRHRQRQPGDETAMAMTSIALAAAERAVAAVLAHG